MSRAWPPDVEPSFVQPDSAHPPSDRSAGGDIPETPPRRARRRRNTLRRSLLRVLVRTFLLSLPLLAFLGLEGLVRLWDGNVLPEGRLLQLTTDGMLELRPGARARLGLEKGVRFQLRVDAQGLRQDPARLSPLPEKVAGQITVTSSRVLMPGEESEEAILVETPARTPAPPTETAGKAAASSSATPSLGSPTPLAHTPVPSRVLESSSSAAQASAAQAGADPILVVGDEAALGWGVGDAETFASLLSAGGQPTYNAAVLAFNVEDSLNRARSLLSRSNLKRVLVVVNEADDYDQVYQPALARIRAVDGWLRPLTGPDAERPVPPLLGDKLHLLYHANLLTWKATAQGASSAAPGWLVDPAARLAAVEAIGEALERFADEHPGIGVGVVFVPSPLRAGETIARSTPWFDELLERGLKPWEQPQPGGLLREALRPDLEFLDVTGAVADSSAWQASTWLSSEGHARLASAIQAWLGRKVELQDGGGSRAGMSEAGPSPVP